MKRTHGLRNEVGFHNHWLHIDADRVERYEEMFQWNPATEHLYASANLSTGHIIGDFGCGPGMLQSSLRIE